MSSMHLVLNHTHKLLVIADKELQMGWILESLVLILLTSKAECRRVDAFELWCWRRLLRVPWTARGSNQSILKEISLGCSVEGLMLKLKYLLIEISIESIEILPVLQPPNAKS